MFPDYQPRHNRTGVHEKNSFAGVELPAAKETVHSFFEVELLELEDVGQVGEATMQYHRMIAVESAARYGKEWVGSLLVPFLGSRLLQLHFPLPQLALHHPKCLGFLCQVQHQVLVHLAEEQVVKAGQER
jgi:hypothetical protein